MSTVIYLGLINWLVTLILVESELTRPVRNWIDGQADMWATLVADGERDPDLRERWDVTKLVLSSKARYLIGCHLCAGTWIGFVLAGVFGGPISAGVVGVVSNGLLYKAIGHATLELTAAFKRHGVTA